MLAGGEGVRQTYRELAGARVARRFDCVLNEAHVRGAKWLFVESVGDSWIDDICVAAAESSEDGPRDASPRRVVEAWVVERKIREPERTAETEP